MNSRGLQLDAEDNSSRTMRVKAVGGCESLGHPGEKALSEVD